jgi:hypothetical protein
LRQKRGRKGGGLEKIYEYGWKTMAECAGVCKRTVQRQKKELIAEKVIDYPLIGRPPKRLMRWNIPLFQEFIKKNQKS